MTSRTIKSITPYVDINSDKLVLNAMTVLLGNGHYAIDTTGETNVVRPQTTRSIKENTRRVLITNSDNESISVQTTCGVMVNAIRDLNPATATPAQIINAVRNAITSTSGKGILVNPPALASSIGLVDVLAQIAVVDPDGNFAINDTAETTLTRVSPLHSLLFLFRQLMGGIDGNIRVNTTSGRKVAAIEALNPNTATAGTIVQVVIDAI